MGLVEFGPVHVQGSSQPGILSETLVSRGGSVGNAPFPRKQRSVMKKRAKYGGQLTRKDGGKKFKKHESISKDEEEVAEALFALANMFTDVSNNDHRNQVPADDAGGSKILVEGSEFKSISSKSNFESGDVDPQPPELLSNEDAVHSDASEVLKSSIPDSSQNLTALGMKPKAVGAEKNGFVMPSSLATTEGLKSKTTTTLSLRLASLSSKDTDYISLTHQADGSNIGSKEENRVKSKKSLKRCANHVKISRMIKVLKLTVKEDSLENTTAPTTCSPLPETIDLNAEEGSVIFNDSEKETENRRNIFLQTHLIQDQLPVSFISSNRHGYNLMSEGRRRGVNEADSQRVVDSGDGKWQEDAKAFQLRYIQSQNQFAFPFSTPEAAAYSSTFHGHQYMSSSFPPQRVNKMASQLQTWGLPNSNGGMQLSEWRNQARSSALTLLPNLYASTAALGSKPVNNNWAGNLSDVHQCFPLRNGAAYRPHLRQNL